MVVTAEDYLKACREAYEARFDDLPAEERGDGHARAGAVAGLMKWYREINLAAIEDSKGKGRGPVMLKKIAKPFIDQVRNSAFDYWRDVPF